MVKKKGKSKRTTLKDKYKIQHRVVEKHRKSRKQAKRDSKLGIVRHDKKNRDPGIPNSWPFKQDLLNEISRARETAESNRKGSGKKKNVTNLEDLVNQAESRREKFEAITGSNSIAAKEDESIRTPKNDYGQQSRKAYLSTLRKVIDASDILLEVLDARDPVGTRIDKRVEDAILKHHDKKLVLVLNKIDLVPKEAVSGWLAALRKSLPALAIKSGTNQSQKDDVGQAKGQNSLSSSSGVGIEGLLGLLKNYARTSEGKKSKTCITVGIIGYPNVGKSSVLNTLKRSRAVGISPRPGFTTTMQEVILDRTVRLIDSPGVVFKDDQVNGSDTLLSNCVDANSISDPIPAVESLLKRCSAESLMMTYSIPFFNKGDVMTFLAMVAKRAGKVLKGGIPDKVTAARTVLRDWNSGKIPYYTVPPSHTADLSNVQVLSTFAKEFDVSTMDDIALKDLKSDDMDFVKVEIPISPSCEQPSNVALETARFLTADDILNDGNDSDMSMEEVQQKGNDASSTSVDAAEAEDYDFESMQ